MVSAHLGSPEDGKREDFCESGAYFFTKPYELYLVAPNRFHAILAILSSHVPPEERENYRQTIYANIDKNKEEFQNKGIAVETIKNAFLAHQKIPKRKLTTIITITI